MALLLSALAQAGTAVAELLIDDFRIDFRGEVEVRINTLADRYYVLLAGESVTSIDEPVDVQLGNDGVLALRARRLPNPDASFFQVVELFRDNPMDLDGDGLDDVWELERSGVLNALSAADAGLDPDGNGRSHLFEYRAARQPLTTLLDSSPADREQGVSPTRETVLRFTAPLAESTLVTPDQAYAETAGRRLLTRGHLASDRRSFTLFYLEPLPGSSRVRVTFDGTGILDAWGRLLDADGDEQAGGVRQVEFETASLTPSADAVVCGRVFASQLAPAGNPEGAKSVNVPLAGVIITADGLEESVRAVTDAFGNFCLRNAPAGEFFVHIDGRPVTDVAQGIRYPDLAYYPYVGKLWKSTPGREVNIGEIYLPLVSQGTLVEVSAVADTVVTFPEAVVAEHPELAGVTLTVPANSLFTENGLRGGRVGIAPVPSDRLPEPLPQGLSAPLVITVQTDGPANFDQPVPVCFPNLPDPATGKALPPGARTGLWSFNHDLGRWEVVGPMTISPDGRFACSDPGYGIRQPGWHFPNPGTPVDGPEDGPEPDVQPPPRDKNTTPASAPGGNGLTCPSGPPNPTDPIRFHSGEFYHVETDLEIPGVGMDFKWVRHYRSRVSGGFILPFGPAWDCSYNIFIRQSGSQYYLHDGNNRVDLLFQARNSWSDPVKSGQNPEEDSRTGSRYGDVVWVQNGLPYELVRRSDGSFRLFFPDRGYWDFAKPKAPAGCGWCPLIGQVQKIVDRNGNTLRLEYDEQDRLVTIYDTLDRPIRVQYTPGSSSIAAITDFTGRTVRYEYYGMGERGGVPGMLKASLSPAVTDTPHGNDFPEGKRTSYTYDTTVVTFTNTGRRSQAFSDNLLTITDGRRNDPRDPTYGEGPWLVNTYDLRDNQRNQRVRDQDYWERSGGYAWTVLINPYLRLSYDRISSQRWGRGTIDIRYEAFLLNPADAKAGVLALYERGTPKPVPPSIEGQPIPGYGARTVVRDRVGNVTEYIYDAFGTARRYLQFTGRSDPTRFVSRTENRPTGRLRPSDPEFFETQYGDDSQGNPNLIRHPNGNEELSVYDSDPRASRNLRSRTRRPFEREGAPFASQPVLTETFEYDTDHGGCCGFNFVTRTTDSRGNSVINQYDEHGNRTNRIHQIPSVTEQWEYNPRGQVTKHVHPDNGSGHRRVDVFEYYESGTSRGYLERQILDFGGLNLTTRFEYDAVGNVTRRIDPNGHDTLYVYNALNQVIQEFSPEVKPGVRYRKDYHYDANNNVQQIDVDNLDEDGNPLAPSRLTTRFEYNLLNSLVRKSQQIAEGHFAITEYDYDANENLVEVRFPECVAGRQPSNRVRYEYDERNLLFREIRAPGTSEESITQYDYDGNKNLVRKTEGAGTPAPRITLQEFDGYDRIVQRTDAMGNITHYGYDANGNLIASRVEGELHDVPGSAGNVRMADVSFQYDPMNRLVRTEEALFDPATQSPVSGGTAVTEVEYNGLSQPIRTVNPNGHASRIAYDTANRRQSLTDAKDNHVRFEYDASGNIVRLVETEKPDLGGADEVFTTRFEYDALDRLISTVDNVGTVQRFGYDSHDNRVLSIDGRGNLIRYAYDGLDQVTETVRPLTDTGDGDGQVIGTLTTRQTWDASGRLTSQIDDNGNATTYLYDGLNRRFATVMADGTGQTNRFDSLGNPVQSDDANGTRVLSQFDTLGRVIRRDVTPGPGVSDDTTFENYRYDAASRLVRAEDDDSVVQLAYDSAGRVLTDLQNGQGVASTHDAAGNQTSLRYPSGRLIQQTFDELERLSTVADEEGVIARYAYVGPTRVARRDTRNGVRMTYEYDGITGVPNPAGDFGVRQIVATTHTRLSDGAVLDDRAYAWDRAGNKTELVERHTGGEHRAFAYDSVNRLIRSMRTPPAGPAETIAYRLDGVGNRIEVVGGPDAGIYTMSDAAPEPADRSVNQYTTTPFDTRTYDRNGNLVAIELGEQGRRVFKPDFRNRLTGIFDAVAKADVLFSYDVLGRQSSITREGAFSSHRETYYAGWRIVEDMHSGTQEATALVYGNYIDEICYLRNAEGVGFPAIDDLFSVNAVISESGSVLASYRFSDYGRPTVISEDSFSEVISLALPYFAGRPYDLQIGLGDFRSRKMDPNVGKFTSRDDLGNWGDPGTLGSALVYAAVAPSRYLDPFGRDIGASGMDASEWGRLQRAEATRARIVEEANRRRVENRTDYLQENWYFPYHPGAIPFLNQPGFNKCNAFVDDVLTAARAMPPKGGRFGRYRPIGAVQWADPGVPKPGWVQVPGGVKNALPGDVLAESGHVGIVTEPGKSTSVNSTVQLLPGLLTQNNWGYKDSNSAIVWRYVGP